MSVTFQTIFSETKMDVKAQKCIDKTCGITTEILLIFMQWFNQFEPEYNQEFHYHWKEILIKMRGSKRAKSFIRHIQQL